MSDTDAVGRSEATGPSNEQRNLPVLVPQPGANLEASGNWLVRMLRLIFRWKAGSIRADLKDVLETGAGGETGFSPEESAMLRNILGLRERRVADVMVPRADIVSVQQDIALGELIKVFEGAGHSRLVVYNDTLDDPAGMVHIRDLIAFMTKGAAVAAKANIKRKKPLPAGLDLKAIDLAMTLSAANIIRTILFVPPSMPAMDLLAKMQTTHIHLALVVDEYGGTEGIVSIEDIVELIVGNIEDEHDYEEAPGVVRQPDGSFIADARASIEEVTAIIGASFDIGEIVKEVDTLGGYLVTRVGRVPVRGELVPGPGLFEIEVLDADPRRVKKVRINRSKDRRLDRNNDARNAADRAAVTVAEKPAADEPERPSSEPTPVQGSHQP
ncbi:MAG: HlyC/CorC family transporter [Rhizobiales bacterium]|nr:HlyC/CorC family transporter [Hyphomicrobiales bacterium]